MYSYTYLSSDDSLVGVLRAVIGPAAKSVGGGSECINDTYRLRESLHKIKSQPVCAVVDVHESLANHHSGWPTKYISGVTVRNHNGVPPTLLWRHCQ